MIPPTFFTRGAARYDVIPIRQTEAPRGQAAFRVIRTEERILVLTHEAAADLRKEALQELAAGLYEEE